MPAPATPIDAIYPDWTNLVDIWRDTDAEWLRNRVVQLFPDVASRTTALSGKTVFGMLSAIASGSLAGGPDFWNGTGWESVRYPGLNYDPATFTLRRQGASPGTGIQLQSDGSVNMRASFTGTGTDFASGIGTYVDNTGLSIKIGTKAVKFTTDTTQLMIDSPVRVGGALVATGAITAPSASLNTLAVSGALTAASLSAPTITAATSISAPTVTGGDVVLGSSGVYGTVKHRTGGTAEVDVGSDSTVRVLGTSLAVTPPTTFAGAVTVNGQTNFVGRPMFTFPSSTATWVAALYALQGSANFPADCPDGTIGITY